jgi:putative molybdopterin biosynthesis protein
MKSKRNIYLNMKSLEEAKAIIDKFDIEKAESETVLTVNSVKRVLSEPVYAKVSSPDYHAAAMDGIALDAKKSFGASETSPKKLIIGKNAFYINTGNIMPKDTNAVIMIEHVNKAEDGVIIEAPAFPWQYVRKIGEDIVATELLFPTNHVISPYCIGALLSGGVYEVSVRKKPRVLIIPTGSELADWRQTEAKDIKKGAVLETNSYVLGNLAKECGAEFKRFDITEDNQDVIKKAVADGIEDFDMILICGGSSAGSKDYSKEVIEDLGEVLVHGVTIMPGKPAIIGKIKNKPVIGIPGYPISAIIAFEHFAAPFIFKMRGIVQGKRDNIKVSLTRKMASKLGVEEFVRVKLGRVGEKITAAPLPRGAGSISSITKADGIIRIPAHIEGILDNEDVYAELLPTRVVSDIENTIVAIGSHDNSLDVLADALKASAKGIILSSSHVGSMGGLMAIKRKTCHIAGTHLLDTKDSSYNISYIKRYLPDIKLKLINLVLRDQGFIVAKKNPKNIQNIKDLTQDIVFINRQLGSGTRILFDFKLKESEVNPDDIGGYSNEEFTHMTVAAAVLSGAADAGLGIYAAAKALGLDFIPVITERYDLVIPEEHFNLPIIQNMLEIIKTSAFQKRVEDLGGYDTKMTGSIMFEK